MRPSMIALIAVTASALAANGLPGSAPPAFAQKASAKADPKAAQTPQKKAAEARLGCRTSGVDAINVTIVNGTATDIAGGTRIKWTVGPGAKRCRATPVSEVVTAPGVLPPGGTITLSVPDPRTPCATRCDVEFVK